MVATGCYHAMNFLDWEEPLFTGPAILPDSELRCPLPFSVDDTAPWKGPPDRRIPAYLGKAPQQFAYRASPSEGGERREMEIPVEG